MANILVMGSTGGIGKEVCEALADKKVAFRAAVTKIEKAKNIIAKGPNIEAAEVDINIPETVVKSLSGIKSVFLMTPPGQTGAALKLVDIFKNAGVRVVKLSGFGVEGEKLTKKNIDAFTFAEEHVFVEEALKRADVPTTIIRPSSFHSNILRDSNAIKERSTISNLQGTTKQNWVSNKDIGEAVAVILTSEGHQGKTYNLLGPDNITWDEVAKMISEIVGREIKYEQIDEQTLRQHIGFMPPTVIDGVVNLNNYMKNGGYDIENNTTETNDLEKLIGSKGRKLRDFIIENKFAFA